MAAGGGVGALVVVVFFYLSRKRSLKARGDAAAATKQVTLDDEGASAAGVGSEQIGAKGGPPQLPAEAGSPKELPSLRTEAVVDKLLAFVQAEQIEGPEGSRLGVSWATRREPELRADEGPVAPPTTPRNLLLEARFSKLRGAVRTRGILHDTRLDVLPQSIKMPAPGGVGECSSEEREERRCDGFSRSRHGSIRSLLGGTARQCAGDETSTALPMQTRLPPPSTALGQQANVSGTAVPPLPLMTNPASSQSKQRAGSVLADGKLRRFRRSSSREEALGRKMSVSATSRPERLSGRCWGHGGGKTSTALPMQTRLPPPSTALGQQANASGTAAPPLPLMTNPASSQSEQISVSATSHPERIRREALATAGLQAWEQKGMTGEPMELHTSEVSRSVVESIDESWQSNEQSTTCQDQTDAAELGLAHGVHCRSQPLDESHSRPSGQSRQAASECATRQNKIIHI